MDLIRNITKSVNKYFDLKRGSVRLYLEGQDMDMAPLDEWAELRITGPRIKKTNKIWFLQIDINIMCSAKPTNIYWSQEIASMFAQNMDSINIYDETDVLLGCFQLRDDIFPHLDIVPWGRVDVPEISVIQTSVEGFYKMEITP